MGGVLRGLSLRQDHSRSYDHWKDRDRVCVCVRVCVCPSLKQTLSSLRCCNAR